MLAYVVAHWQDILLAILAVDVALIPIFPNAGILGSIRDFLKGIVPSKAP